MIGALENTTKNLLHASKLQVSTFQRLFMATNKAAQLVFVPAPGAGHLFSTVEMATLLVDLHSHLFVTIIVMKLPHDSKLDAYIQSASSLSSATRSRINFVVLPVANFSPDIPPFEFFSSFIQSQIPHIRNAVKKIVEPESDPSDSPRLAGFVLDMFCTSIMDLADEFGVASYLFHTSSAAFLALAFRIQTLTDEGNMDFTELALPGVVNPIPAKVIPGVFSEKDWNPIFLAQVRKYRDCKGIMVNTFRELESGVLPSFCDGKVPPVYPVGPVLNLRSSGSDENSDIMKWLNAQPPSSVVFFCFGSFGCSSAVQAKEIACALEQSGHRFVWSLRQPSPKGNMAPPFDCENPNEILPEGFLDRTAEIGKVIGWAPQAAILAHPSIGGFVSHCGWNSTLESIWFGVPMATWPMYAEQQFNAFQIVKELGVGVDIKLDYNMLPPDGEEVILVSADEIERGIRCVMKQDSDVRRKMKEMSEKSKMALMDGGSSRTSLSHFIKDVMDDIS